MRPSTLNEIAIKSTALSIINRETNDTGRTRTFESREIGSTLFSTKDFGKGLTVNARQPTSGKHANVFCIHWSGKLIEPQTLLYRPDGAGWEASLRKLAGPQKTFVKTMA